MNKYIILGGGVAGLATAIQLLKAGKNVELFEKNPKNQAQGHAFILMPNGLAALDKIGVKEAVTKAAHPINNFQLHDPEGVLQTQQDLSRALGIRRGILVDILPRIYQIILFNTKRSLAILRKMEADKLRKQFLPMVPNVKGMYLLELMVFGLRLEKRSILIFPCLLLGLEKSYRL